MWDCSDTDTLGHGYRGGGLKKATVPRGNLDKPKKLFRLP